jgi:integrase
VVDHVTVERQHMKKKVEGRTVPLHPEAKEALAEWLAELQHDPRYSEDLPLFISRKGRKAISRVAAWRIMEEVWQVNEMTGKLGTHSLRKTFADRVHTRLNGDLLKTQRALGHRNVNSTVSYLSFREEEIEQAIITC